MEIAIVGYTQRKMHKLILKGDEGESDTFNSLLVIAEGPEFKTFSSLHRSILVTAIRVIHVHAYIFPFTLCFVCKSYSSVGGVHLRESLLHPSNLIVSNRLVKVQYLCPT